MTPLDDRALHDAVIRMLADAPFRAAVLSGGGAHDVDGVPAEHVRQLRAASPERVRRFARFLARQFYQERVAHFYKYSRALARWTGRAPEGALAGAALEGILEHALLGSSGTAREIAALVERHLAAATGEVPPYAGDLARYESAQLVVEAGPRVWRSDAASPRVDEHTVLAQSDRAIGLELAWDLPAVLPLLLDPSVATLPEAPRRPTQLLVARTARGRVTVMRWTPPLDALLRALDGQRDLTAAATQAGLPASDTIEIAAALVEVGAVHAG